MEDKEHRVVLEVKGEGGVVGLDYVVGVSVANPPGEAGGVGVGAGAGGVVGTTTVVGGVTTTLVPGEGVGGGGQTVAPAPTAVFPGQQGSTGNGKNGAAGLAIGLTLGILAGIVSPPFPFSPTAPYRPCLSGA